MSRRPVQASAATVSGSGQRAAAAAAANHVRIGIGDEQQRGHPSTQPLSLARLSRLLLRVALRRERGELVDVGEHGLGSSARVSRSTRAPIASLETRRQETRAPSR